MRSTLRSIFSWFEKKANARGYRISWTPPTVINTPDSELAFDLEFVVAHLMLRKKDIFFIQIGANDGKSVDPIYKFATEFGWSGVLVEPLPHVFELLKANYKDHGKLKLLNAALSEKDGSRTMYTVRIDKDTFKGAHAYSSFDRSVVARQTRWVPDIASRIEEISVRCISMETLLREAGANQVDLLQIDAEGYDFEILKMIDFARLRPTIICFEHAHLTKAQMNAAAALLRAQGYRMTRDNLDTIAYRPNFTFGWHAIAGATGLQSQ